ACAGGEGVAEDAPGKRSHCVGEATLTRQLGVSRLDLPYPASGTHLLDCRRRRTWTSRSKCDDGRTAASEMDTDAPIQVRSLPATRCAGRVIVPSSGAAGDLSVLRKGWARQRERSCKGCGRLRDKARHLVKLTEAYQRHAYRLFRFRPIELLRRVCLELARRLSTEEKIMSDDLSKRGGQDRTRIDVSQA